MKQLNKNIKTASIIIITLIINILCIFGWRQYYLILHYYHPERFYGTSEWEVLEFKDNPCLSGVENMYEKGIALSYAIYLSDCFDQPDADYYVFASLQKTFKDSGKNLPQKTFETIALPYLKHGAEKGSELCIKQLFDLYNDELYIKSDSTLCYHYKSLYDSIQVVHIQDSIQRAERRNIRMMPEDSAKLAAKAKEVATKLLNVIDSLNSL